MSNLSPVNDRFIPAYAGNTEPHEKKPSVRSVHPRLRGEHTQGGRSMHSSRGSSPPTRGTPDSVPLQPQQRRFIPAYAGNTRVETHPGTLLPVHPRLRGEHNDQIQALGLGGGSSPPTRGTRRAIRHEQQRVRFIPAYAGNTWGTTTRRRSGSVHPRLRGEHLATTKARLTPDGSSPPTRGTHHLYRTGQGA